MNDSIHKERKLAYLLRHDKNYSFDEHGWREARDLTENHGFSREELTAIVANSSKLRFEFSEDGMRIRARQGHSVNVDVELQEAIPPEYLYHGTPAANLPSIMQYGLSRMGRQYVHLSYDETTAIQVGSRRKDDVAILKISTHRMREDGHRFWLSRNDVWLTDTIPPSYFEIQMIVKRN